MVRRLTANVILADPETGAPVIFEEGEEVPAWAADLITTPGLLGEDSADPADLPEGSAPDPDGSEEPDPAGSDVPIPPKKGPKATVAAWAEYAAAQGFELDDDATRADIIAALEADGIPTE